MRSLLNKIALGLVALAAVSAPAFAQQSLPANSSNVNIDDILLGASPFGGVLEASQTSNFTSIGAGVINATLRSAVFRVGTGPTSTLDFYYQIVNTNSTFEIANGGVNSFANATLSVGQTNEDVDGGGSLSAIATSAFGVASRGGGTGPDVNFTFNVGGNTGLASGATSNIFFVRSNANTFTTAGSFSLQGGGVVAASNGPVIAAIPTVNVPEANAGLLMGLALPLIGGVAVLRRRKK